MKKTKKTVPQQKKKTLNSEKSINKQQQQQQQQEDEHDEHDVKAEEVISKKTKQTTTSSNNAKQKEQEKKTTKSDDEKEENSSEQVDASDSDECPDELHQCVEFLKSELVKLPQAKWPKKRSDLIIFAKKEYYYSWQPQFLVTFLLESELIAKTNEGSFLFDIEKIKNFSFESIPQIMIKSLQKHFKKKESAPKVEVVQISSVEKVVAWLKLNHQQQQQQQQQQQEQEQQEDQQQQQQQQKKQIAINKPLSIKKLLELLVDISKVKVEVQPELVVEQLEEEEVVKFSKKDGESIEYDLQLLLVEKTGYCYYVLGILVVALLYSTLLSNIFSF